MPAPPWLERWQQRDDDELLYTSLSDEPPAVAPEAQAWWDALYMPLSHPTPRTGPRVFWPGYARYLEQRPQEQRDHVS
jgi:hypothetical protein